MQSENEKLRTLLAEAREWADAIGVNIDAALAEPVAECADCANSFRLAGTRERERDEARAEVNMLRILLNQSARNERLWRQREQKWLPTLNAARTHAEEAFRRGAEAMREAAAGKAYTTLSLYDEPCRRSELRQAVVNAIEALPLPEGKP